VSVFRSEIDSSNRFVLKHWFIQERIKYEWVYEPRKKKWKKVSNFIHPNYLFKTLIQWRIKCESWIIQDELLLLKKRQCSAVFWGKYFPQCSKNRKQYCVCNVRFLIMFAELVSNNTDFRVVFPLGYFIIQ